MGPVVAVGELAGCVAVAVGCRGVAAGGTCVAVAGGAPVGVTAAGCCSDDGTAVIAGVAGGAGVGVTADVLRDVGSAVPGVSRPLAPVAGGVVGGSFGWVATGDGCAVLVPAAATAGAALTMPTSRRHPAHTRARNRRIHPNAPW